MLKFLFDILGLALFALLTFPFWGIVLYVASFELGMCLIKV